MEDIQSTHVNFAFCEGTIYPFAVTPHIEEFVNCLTSLIFVYVGLLGGLIHRNIKLEKLTLLLYATLTVCGIGSALFHAQLIYKFKYLDEFAMIHLASLGFYVCCCHMSGNQIWRFICGIVAILFDIILIEINIFLLNPNIFRILFSVPIIAVYIMFKYNMVNKTEIQKKLIKYAFISSLIAIICWLIDFHFCYDVPSFNLFYHGLWHIMIAHATVNLIELGHITYIIKSHNIIPSISYISGPFVFWDLICHND